MNTKEQKINQNTFNNIFIDNKTNKDINWSLNRVIINCGETNVAISYKVLLILKDSINTIK